MDKDESDVFSESDEEAERGVVMRNTSNHYTLNMPRSTPQSDPPYVLIGYLQFFIDLSLIYFLVLCIPRRSAMSSIAYRSIPWLRTASFRSCAYSCPCRHRNRSQNERGNTKRTKAPRTPGPRRRISVQPGRRA